MARTKQRKVNINKTGTIVASKTAATSKPNPIKQNDVKMIAKKSMNDMFKYLENNGLLSSIFNSNKYARFTNDIQTKLGISVESGQLRSTAVKMINNKNKLIQNYQDKKLKDIFEYEEMFDVFITFILSNFKAVRKVTVTYSNIKTLIETKTKCININLLNSFIIYAINNGALIPFKPESNISQSKQHDNFIRDPSFVCNGSYNNTTHDAVDSAQFVSQYLDYAAMLNNLNKINMQSEIEWIKVEFREFCNGLNNDIPKYGNLFLNGSNSLIEPSGYEYKLRDDINTLNQQIEEYRQNSDQLTQQNSLQNTNSNINNINNMNILEDISRYKSMMNVSSSELNIKTLELEKHINRSIIHYHNLFSTIKNGEVIGSSPLYGVGSSKACIFIANKIIGNGSSGSVIKASAITDNKSEHIILKIAKNKQDTSLTREFDIMQKLSNHKIQIVSKLFINKLIKNGNNHILSMVKENEAIPYCFNEQKYDYIIGCEILLTLAQFNVLGLVHLDIKTENTLFNERHRSITLVDYGETRPINTNCGYIDIKHLKYIPGTNGYILSEIYNDKKVYTVSDVWSAVIVWFMLINFYQPFDKQYKKESNYTGDKRQALLKTQNKTGFSEMLTFDHTKRPTSQQRAEILHNGVYNNI